VSSFKSRLRCGTTGLDCTHREISLADVFQFRQRDSMLASIPVLMEISYFKVK
jgi:hypothetical protein